MNSHTVHAGTKIAGVVQPVYLHERTELTGFAFIHLAVALNPGFHAKAGLDIAISGAFNTGTVAFTVFIRFYTHPDNLCLRLNIPFIQTIFVAPAFQV